MLTLPGLLRDDRLRRPTAALLTVLITLLVGWLDHWTGSEIRILALYFLPLVLAGWYLGEVGAAFAAAFAVAVWLTAQYMDDVQFSTPVIWVINGLTEGLGFFVVAILVAKLRRALLREQTLGRTDQLTGLANRRAFFERCNLALEASRREDQWVSLAYIDLNNFKRVNDQHGHKRGDEILRHCAHLIASHVRPTDVASRLGGDEFVIFLPKTDPDAAQRSMARLREAIAAAPPIRQHDVSVSIGIAGAMANATSLDALLGQADASMYRAKQRV